MENNIPFVAIEMMATKQDRAMKRLCIAFIVAICIVCICNAVMFCCWCFSERNEEREPVTASEVYEDGTH